MVARELAGGDDVPEAVTRDAVGEIVRRQADIGIAILNDGEVSKPQYATYVKDRLTGFESLDRPAYSPARDLDEHPDFVQMTERIGWSRPMPIAVCTGPIAVNDRGAVRRDVANLLSAAEAAGVGTNRLFMSAASPGVIAHFIENRHYPDRESYLAALVEAMRYEYTTIVNAGITLQLDCPDFAMSYNTIYQHLSVDEFRKEVSLAVEALNAAVEGLAPERLRVHLCWGNSEGPHTHDIALRDIIDIVLGCHVRDLDRGLEPPPRPRVGGLR